jgi:hypothetical protein
MATASDDRACCTGWTWAARSSLGTVNQGLKDSCQRSAASQQIDGSVTKARRRATSGPKIAGKNSCHGRAPTRFEKSRTRLRLGATSVLATPSVKQNAPTSLRALPLLIVKLFIAGYLLAVFKDLSQMFKVDSIKAIDNAITSTSSVAEIRRLQVTPIQASAARPGNDRMVRLARANARRMGFTAWRDDEIIDVDALNAAIKNAPLDQRMNLKSALYQLGLIPA